MGQQMENRPEEDMQRWAAADCVAGRFGDYAHRRCRSAVDCDDHWIAAGSSRLPKVLRCWQRQEKRKPPSGTPYRCRWRLLKGTGFPIFRQVQDNYRFGRRATHRSGFRSKRPESCNLSTTSPLVINRVTIRLTSPRRLIPAANRRTQPRTR